MSMTKLVIDKVDDRGTGNSSNAVTHKRVRDTATGRMTTIHTIDARSKTLSQDFKYVFAKNVAKARRENKAITGANDQVPQRT